MALAVQDILEIKVYTTEGSQGGINVLHARVGAVGGASLTESAAAAALSPILAPLWKPALHSTASYRGIGVRRLKPVLGLEYFSIVSQGPGTGTGDPLPKQTAGVVSVKTILPGRRGRGRVYVPFPAEGHNDTDATPTAGYLTFIDAIGTELKSVRVLTVGADSVSILYGVYHRSTTLIDDIASYQARDRWGTQRRRSDFGKTNILPI